MRRIVIVVLLVAVAAFGGWYYWNSSQQFSSDSVSVLLPRQTILLAQIPDFNRSIDEWHHCDIYQLYREPAVQEFLRPGLAGLANASQTNTTSQAIEEIQQVDPKNAFIALTSVENNNAKLVGGFRVRGSREDAERMISKWRSQFLQQSTVKHEKIQYQRHEIDIASAAPFTIATTYDQPWFFAATDLTELKALLDRADHRVSNREGTLDADDAYRSAIAHRPSNFAAFFYLQPKVFADRLRGLGAAVRSSPGDSTMLENMHCITGAIRFENGKIHDVFFVGLPKLEQNIAITRSSLSLGTKETFLYMSLLLNVGAKIETLNHAASFAGTKLLQALADSGITADDWKAAFGVELEALADWPSTAHWPSLLMTVPVTDTAKAVKIVEGLIQADQDSTWTQSTNGGVRYFSKQSAAGFVAITPTIAVSDRNLVVGLDPVSVEEALKRSSSGSKEFANSPTYNTAERLLPPPTNFFGYVDTALLYSRLDAALRPMLLMASAFVPAVAGAIDATKLPPPEVITKHLSPIVSSQRYDGDGYVAESIGPITLDQAAIGGVILSSFGPAARQKVGTTGQGWILPPAATAQPNASPTPTP